MSVITDPEKIENVLTRGVAEIIGVDDLRTRMLAGEQLRIKLGIDPTSSNLHLGRSIPLLKLRDFQELGHQVVLIVGGFTAQVGDTSDKDSERPMLTAEAVMENGKTYFDQAAKILDIDKVELHNNAEWLTPLSFGQVSVMADEFSVNDFIARDVIARRLTDGKRVSLREMLYPLMQGYDSVMINADVELGGTDQRFNCLAGRTLQKSLGKKPQAIVVGPIINGPDGTKMSSSKGNVIPIGAEPNDMFGKLMTVRDDMIIEYFEVLTRVPIEDIALYKHHLDNGVNPRDVKLKLAHAITSFYHSVELADAAQDEFINRFSNNALPSEIPVMQFGSRNIIDVLVDSGLVTSRSEAKRQIGQGAVRVNQEPTADEGYEVALGDVVSKGKLGFVKVG